MTFWQKSGNRYGTRVREFFGARPSWPRAGSETIDADRANPEFVPPGHYYSAIPDVRDVLNRRADVFERDPLDIAGVDLRLHDQLALLDELAQFMPDVPFTDEPRRGQRYHFANGVFEHADGLFLHLILRHLQPKRVLEIGSGYSSVCALDTVDAFVAECRCTFVDPHADLLRSLLRPGDLERVDLIERQVQSVPLETFQELEAGDLLFIDSTHVVKVGSDVNYLFFDVLPRLREGVVVHVHDVFPGFEYPQQWLQDRRFWSEAYLVRAFLLFNTSFEIALWPSLVAETSSDTLVRFPPALENTGGSIYLRRSRSHSG